FRINTNVGAMNAHRNATMNNVGLDKSLKALSSGLRINSASDDAAGLSIANQLGAQANGLGQAISNANDGMAVMQTADGALEEYTNILNTVRTKAIQASSDSQNDDSRAAIQQDISKLLEAAQNISENTSFNGQKLLDGTFSGKSFHVGAYANETVDVSITSTQTNAIGAFAETEGTALTAVGTQTLIVNGTATAASSADTATGANTTAHSAGSAWAIAKEVNAISNATSVTATAATTTADAANMTAGVATVNVTAGTLAADGLTINGISVGLVGVSANDSDNALRNAINAVSNESGVTASNDGGKMVLTSNDGSDITIAGTDAAAISGLNNQTTGGKITLTSDTAFTTDAQAGFLAVTHSTANVLNSIDVSTRGGAETAIKTADAALKNIDKIRSNIGSTQNQLESTVRN
ncbi:MAG TPA: flagellin, partial [Sulfurimonas sp.]|nr:flagellin [Sulfurimonas sp.]